MATKNAWAIGTGHTFRLGRRLLSDNVLTAVKTVPEVCYIFCATANPPQVIVAESEQGRGIWGVIDGCKPQSVEDEQGGAWRKGLLRQIGYKSG